MGAGDGRAWRLAEHGWFGCCQRGGCLDRFFRALTFFPIRQRIFLPRTPALWSLTLAWTQPFWRTPNERYSQTQKTLGYGSADRVAGAEPFDCRVSPWAQCYRVKGWRSRQGSARVWIRQHLYRALPKEDRKALRGELSDRHKQGSKLRAQDFAALSDALRATPFDPAAVQVLLQQQAQAMADLQYALQDEWLDRVSEMSDTERQAYASRLEEVVRRKPHRHKRKGLTGSGGALPNPNLITPGGFRGIKRCVGGFDQLFQGSRSMQQ